MRLDRCVWQQDKTYKDGSVMDLWDPEAKVLLAWYMLKHGSPTQVYSAQISSVVASMYKKRCKAPSQTMIRTLSIDETKAYLIGLLAMAEDI